MKLSKIRKILFLIIVFGTWFYVPAVNASGCGFMCGDATNPMKVCTDILGTIGSTYGAGAQCKGSYECGNYQKLICCCTADNNIIVPGGALEKPNATIKPPTFEIPDLQIELTGLKLTKPNCVQNGDGQYMCKINWLGEYITWIYNYALKVAGILAAIVLMAAGVLWLISAGDAGKVGQAKEMIIGAVTGLIILLASYILLTEINPDLVKFRSISIGALNDQQISEIVKSYSSGEAASAQSSGCATDTELKNGVNFYATGYCRPAWIDSKKFFCLIAMNCSCPLGSNTAQNCDEFFPNNKNYHPCNKFESTEKYCHETANGTTPYIGSIAGPVGAGNGKCNANLAYGDKVCFKRNASSKGITYTITDTGGAIQGKRIDIWTEDCSKAGSVTGTGVLTKGACAN